MKQKTLFILCALVPAVGSSLGAYYIGQRQARQVVFEVARPVQTVTLSVDDAYAYPRATLVSQTQGSGTSIRAYLTADSPDTVLSYYREKLTDPFLRQQQERVAAMRARVQEQRMKQSVSLGRPLPPLHPSFLSHPLPFGSNSSYSSSSFGNGSTSMSISGSGSQRTGRISTSNNEREVTVTVDAEGNQTRIRTVLITK